MGVCLWEQIISSGTGNRDKFSETQHYNLEKSPKPGSVTAGELEHSKVTQIPQRYPHVFGGSLDEAN